MFIKNVRYTFSIGHYPKGSEIEERAKKNHESQKGNRNLVWVGEILNPGVTGFSRTHGVSKQNVINKLVEYITAGQTIPTK